MERLTARNERFPDETYYPYCFREDTCGGEGMSDKCDICEFPIKICKRLAEYEDTGLTPQEIMELKARDTAKEIQKVDEQPYFRKHFHSYICPVCHKKVEFGWLFCGHCGRKLKKKE